jgi:hypothetical protein
MSLRKLKGIHSKETAYKLYFNSLFEYYEQQMFKEVKLVLLGDSGMIVTTPLPYLLVVLCRCWKIIAN